MQDRNLIIRAIEKEHLKFRHNSSAESSSININIESIDLMKEKELLELLKLLNILNRVIN